MTGGGLGTRPLPSRMKLPSDRQAILDHAATLLAHLPGRHDQGKHGNRYRRPTGSTAKRGSKQDRSERELTRPGRERQGQAGLPDDWNASGERAGSMQRAWTQEAAREIAGDDLDPADVARVLSHWGTTSNGDGVALALQIAVQRELDVKDVFDLSDDEWGPLAADRDRELDQQEGLYRRVARGEYDRTQRMMREAGVSRVTVYRGSGPVEADGDSMRFRPISSFTTDRALAEEYAREMGGVVIEVTAPRERVFGTARTGHGTVRESEVVLLGGRHKVKVTEP